MGELTDIGRELCKTEPQPFAPYLALDAIKHRRMQGNGRITSLGAASRSQALASEHGLLPRFAAFGMAARTAHDPRTLWYALCQFRHPYKGTQNSKTGSVDAPICHAFAFCASPRTERPLMNHSLLTTYRIGWQDGFDTAQVGLFSEAQATLDARLYMELAVLLWGLTPRVGVRLLFAYQAGYIRGGASQEDELPSVVPPPV